MTYEDECRHDDTLNEACARHGKAADALAATFPTLGPGCCG
jgi:hypothetical protein